MQKVLITSLILFLVGCSSLHKKAQQHLVDESYEQAIRIYQEILNSDSKDQDAAAGLNKAKTGWISQKLVQVRLLRLAGNHKNSLDLLLDIYNNENIWNVFPKGAAAFTQQEESEYAQGSVEFVILKTLKANQPLKAQFYLDRYATFFQSKVAGKKIDQLQSQVKKIGSQQCRSFSMSLKSAHFYYGKFVRSFCQVWNLSKPSLKRQLICVRGQLYRNIEIDFEAEGFPEKYAVYISDILNKRLQKSPWYEKNGKQVLKFALVGKYQYKHLKEDRELLHSYSISIPYQEERIEKKRESDDKSALATLAATANFLGSLSGSSFKRDNGDGTVTITETKYRTEPREITYFAKSHLQRFKLSLVLNGQFLSKPFDLIHNSKMRHSSIEHENDLPEMDLYPRKANLIGEIEWLNQKADILAEKFERKLVENWETQYCTDSYGELHQDQSLESMFRCLKIKNDKVPHSISMWFMSNMGLSLNETEEVVGEIL